MISYGKIENLIPRFAPRPARKKKSFLAAISSIAVLFTVAAMAAPVSRADGDITLREGWTVQSSAKISAGGDTISTAGFDASSWYKTSAPNTVFAVLVENGVYKDPFFGMNLRSVPGVSYAIGSEFANQEMPSDSPFAVPWWYRKEFEVPAQFNGKMVWLAFRGINYRADIWINGKKVAGSDQVVGAFRRYEFDVTPFVKAGAKNVVAVEVSAPHANELGITWVDWNPTPPDKDMGLWQEVVLSASGPVAVRHAAVETKLDLPATDKAHLTVRAELQNASTAAVKGTLRGQITGASAPIAFSQSVELQAGERRAIAITPDSSCLLKRAESPPLVALSDGRALSPQAHSRIRSREGPRIRQANYRLRHRANRLRTDARGLPPLQSERQTRARPRRRLGARYDAAHQSSAP